MGLSNMHIEQSILAKEKKNTEDELMLGEMRLSTALVKCVVNIFDMFGPCIIMHQNSVTKLIHFYFHKHFIVW
jgi:hypothetical protein